MSLTPAQKRSKLVLGGQHRARVGLAIARLGEGWWTSAELTAAIGQEIPLVKREQRTHDPHGGRTRYAK